MKYYKKVRFFENFRQLWIDAYAEIDNSTPEFIEAIYLNGDYKEDFDKLNERLAGNVGFVYHDAGHDYFEQEDDNWCIPSNCFEFLD